MYIYPLKIKNIVLYCTSLRSPLSERLEQATLPRQDSYKRKTWKLKTETNGCEGKMIYFILLYRHECFTGKYTSRKIHKNYIRDPSGVFSIILHEFIDDVILVIPLYYFIDVILSI